MRTMANLLVLVLVSVSFLLSGVDGFDVGDSLIVGSLLACPCPTEIFCANATALIAECRKLTDDREDCQIIVGWAECPTCVASGLVWCPMTLGGTISGTCTTQAFCDDPLRSDLSTVFTNEAITSLEDCPGIFCEECEEPKVFVCHKPDNRPPHTIHIALSGLEAHLNHGDTLGPCMDNGDG